MFKRFQPSGPSGMVPDLTTIPYSGYISTSMFAVSAVFLACAIAAVHGGPLQMVIMAVTAACGSGRLLLFVAYARRTRRGTMGEEDSRRWAEYFAAGALLFGLCLAAVTDESFAEGSKHERIFATALCIGWASRMITTMPVCPRLCSLTTFAVLAGLSASFIVSGGWAREDLVGGGVAALYNLSLVGSVGRASRRFVRNVNVGRKVDYLEQHDHLTELGNRTMFARCVASALCDKADGTVGVLLINIDRFSIVNTCFGSGAGDEVLRAVARRLRVCVRSDDVIARLGGDEFAVLQRRCRGLADAQALAGRIIDKIRIGVPVLGEVVEVSASIGLAIAPGDGHEADELIRGAGEALARAKEAGGGRAYEFDHSMHATAYDRITMAADLKLAAPRGELCMHYQPVVDRGGEIAYFEALLRWNHPSRGAVSPAVFIPVAEQHGLIVEIGLWALECAVKDASTWQTDHLVAINVSADQIQDASFVESVSDVLRRHRFPGTRLVIEVTESVLIGQPDRVCDILSCLKSMGAKVALDDFGIGYSSLGYLSRFPFDTNKIDRSFVERVPEPNAAAIIRSILSLAEVLNLSVVTEGVETHTQLTLLRDYGCDLIQGYVFSRPLPAREVAMLAARTRSSTSSHIEMAGTALGGFVPRTAPARMPGEPAKIRRRWPRSVPATLPSSGHGTSPHRSLVLNARRTISSNATSSWARAGGSSTAAACTAALP